MTFTGVPSTRTRVGSQILAADMTNTAADAEYIRTRLLTTHDHSEAGNRLFWPLATAQFGGGNVATAMLIAPAVAEDARLFSTLVYVPAALANVTLYVILHGDTTRRFGVTVRNTSLTEVTRFPLEPTESGPATWGMQNGRCHLSQFSVSSAGVYCLDVSVGFGATSQNCLVESFHVGPVFGEVAGPYDKPDALALSAHTIRAHQTVDPATTAVDGPMGQAVMMINENMARLIEEATGLPVPGNAARTATPHTHDGTTGKALNLPVASLTFGITASAVTGVTVSATGNNCTAPSTDLTSLNTVAQFSVRTPVRTHVTASTTFPPGASDSKLRVAVLVDNDTTKHAARCWVDVGDSVGVGAVRFKASADGRQVLTAPDSTAPYQSSLNFASGDYSTFYVKIRSDVVGASFSASCHAVLLYLEE